MKEDRDFPSGPVANTPYSTAGGTGFDPWSGTQIPHSGGKKKGYTFCN